MRASLIERGRRLLAPTSKDREQSPRAGSGRAAGRPGGRARGHPGGGARSRQDPRPLAHPPRARAPPWRSPTAHIAASARGVSLRVDVPKRGAPPRAATRAECMRRLCARVRARILSVILLVGPPPLTPFRATAPQNVPGRAPALALALPQCSCSPPRRPCASQRARCAPALPARPHACCAAHCALCAARWAPVGACERACVRALCVRA